MIKKYQIKEIKDCTLIHIDDIEKIRNQDGFFVFIVKTLNPEDVADAVDYLGDMGFNVPFFVANNDMDVYEVVKKIEESDDIKKIGE